MASFETACNIPLHIGSDKMEANQGWPGRIEILKEAFRKIVLPSDENTAIFEVRLNRVIGHSACVPAPAKGEMLFAIRSGMYRVSRVVVNGPRIPTDTIVITATKNLRQNTWWLADFYYGPKLPREPLDPYFLKKENFSKVADTEEFDRSVEFYLRNGFLYNPFTMSDTHWSTWYEEINRVPVTKAERKIVLDLWDLFTLRPLEERNEFF